MLSTQSLFPAPHRSRSFEGSNYHTRNKLRKLPRATLRSIASLKGEDFEMRTPTRPTLSSLHKPQSGRDCQILSRPMLSRHRTLPRIMLSLPGSRKDEDLETCTPSNLTFSIPRTPQCGRGLQIPNSPRLSRPLALPRAIRRLLASRKGKHLETCAPSLNPTISSPRAILSTQPRFPVSRRGKSFQMPRSHTLNRPRTHPSATLRLRESRKGKSPEMPNSITPDKPRIGYKTMPRFRASWRVRVPSRMLFRVDLISDRSWHLAVQALIHPACTKEPRF